MEAGNGTIYEPLMPVAVAGTAVMVGAAAGYGVRALIVAAGAKAVAPVAKELSKQEAKAIRSYEKRIAEHEKKLTDFKENPTVKPGMEKQSVEAVEAQQAARVQHLEKEIKTFKENVQKIKDQ